DDHCVLAAAAVLDRLQQLDEVARADALTRVAGVLVVLTDRLDETDRLELAALLRAPRERQERLLIAQVIASHRRAGRERGEVVQWLVVVLEQLVRAVGKGRARSGVRIRTGRPVAVRPTGRADV